MSKVKVTDLFQKVFEGVSKGEFTEADKNLDLIVKGKIKNKIEAEKTKIFAKK